MLTIKISCAIIINVARAQANKAVQSYFDLLAQSVEHLTSPIGHQEKGVGKFQRLFVLSKKQRRRETGWQRWRSLQELPAESGGQPQKNLQRQAIRWLQTFAVAGRRSKNLPGRWHSRDARCCPVRQMCPTRSRWSRWCRRFCSSLDTSMCWCATPELPGRDC